MKQGRGGRGVWLFRGGGGGRSGGGEERDCGGEGRGVVERGDEWWRGDEGMRRGGEGVGRGEKGRETQGGVPPLFHGVYETRKIPDTLLESRIHLMILGSRLKN